MARAKLSVRTFTTHRRSAAGPWSSRRERSLIKQREEQFRCCSLIYKVPVLWRSGAAARLSRFPIPVETFTAPRRRKLHIVPSRRPSLRLVTTKYHSFRCSSSSSHKRFAGLRDELDVSTFYASFISFLSAAQAFGLRRRNITHSAAPPLHHTNASLVCVTKRT